MHVSQMPNILSTIPTSPFYNKELCELVDKVFVDGVHVPDVVSYNIPKGFVFHKAGRIVNEKTEGVVTLTLKGD
jgi:hypothetical protein